MCVYVCGTSRMLKGAPLQDLCKRLEHAACRLLTCVLHSMSRARKCQVGMLLGSLACTVCITSEFDTLLSLAREHLHHVRCIRHRKNNLIVAASRSGMHYK